MKKFAAVVLGTHAAKPETTERTFEASGDDGRLTANCAWACAVCA
jgi:hypothetical protein